MKPFLNKILNNFDEFCFYCRVNLKSIMLTDCGRDAKLSTKPQRPFELEIPNRGPGTSRSNLIRIILRYEIWRQFTFRMRLDPFFTYNFFQLLRVPPPGKWDVSNTAADAGLDAGRDLGERWFDHYFKISNEMTSRSW